MKIKDGFNIEEKKILGRKFYTIDGYYLDGILYDFEERKNDKIYLKGLGVSKIVGSKLYGIRMLSEHNGEKSNGRTYLMNNLDEKEVVSIIEPVYGLNKDILEQTLNYKEFRKTQEYIALSASIKLLFELFENLAKINISEKLINIRPLFADWSITFKRFNNHVSPIIISGPTSSSADSGLIIPTIIDGRLRIVNGDNENMLRIIESNNLVNSVIEVDFLEVRNLNIYFGCKIFNAYTSTWETKINSKYKLGNPSKHEIKGPLGQIFPYINNRAVKLYSISGQNFNTYKIELIEEHNRVNNSKNEDKYEHLSRLEILMLELGIRYESTFKLREKNQLN